MNRLSSGSLYTYIVIGQDDGWIVSTIKELKTGKMKEFKRYMPEHNSTNVRAVLMQLDSLTDEQMKDIFKSVKL